MKIKVIDKLGTRYVISAMENGKLISTTKDIDRAKDFENADDMLMSLRMYASQKQQEKKFEKVLND